MSNLFKIVPLILLTGWFAGCQLSDHSDSHLYEYNFTQPAGSDTGTILPAELTPLLSAKLTGSVSERLKEINPDINRLLAKPFGRDLFSLSSFYLRLSGQTVSNQLVRMLLFPFHTYL